MVGTLEGNDAWLVRREERGLERGFHGLKAGVAEDGLADASPTPAGKRQCGELLRKFGFQRVRMHVAHGVQERGHLPLSGADDARVRMSGCGDAKGSGEVQIWAAFDVPNRDALGPCPYDGPGAVRRHEGDVARLMRTEQVEGLLGLCLQRGQAVQEAKSGAFDGRLNLQTPR